MIDIKTLKKLIYELVRAEVARSWMGTYQPEEHDQIKTNLINALDKLNDYLEEHEND